MIGLLMVIGFLVFSIATLWVSLFCGEVVNDVSVAPHWRFLAGLAIPVWFLVWFLIVERAHGLI